jgi:hypothetical protein
MSVSSVTVNQVKKKIAYTTGDVAKLCQCAPRTVSKWFDSGVLYGYRLPESKDRRIPHDSLLKFMREAGIPIPAHIDDSWQSRVAVGQ